MDQFVCAALLSKIHGQIERTDHLISVLCQRTARIKLRRFPAPGRPETERYVEISVAIVSSGRRPLGAATLPETREGSTPWPAPSFRPDSRMDRDDSHAGQFLKNLRCGRGTRSSGKVHTKLCSSAAGVV